MESAGFFAKGTLAARVDSVTAQALRSGALQPISTKYETVADGGIFFLVRVLESLVRKDEDARQSRRNPFLPYEEDLFVAELTASHIALLNKFNVIDRHLLVVTREFVHQDEYPGTSDFEALLTAMAEYDSLGFYNGGTVGGASQTHKHLQVVPLPLRSGDAGTPVDAAVSGALQGKDTGVSRDLPFLHAVGRVEEGWFDDPAVGSERALHRFHELLAGTGMEGSAPRPGGRQSGPYNFLLTRRWMLLVPRSCEYFAGASVNSLGFAGALLVRSREELKKLKGEGPLKVLAAVSFPPPREEVEE